MEIPSHPAPRVARGLLGDGWIGRLAEAAEPWLLERFQVVARTPVEQVHLGWGGEAAREVVVSWCTPTSVPDPFVAVAGRIVPARSEPIPGGGWAHHAWVVPLDPATTFTYAVGHAGRVRSRPSRFRTAPIGPAPFVFTALGDHRIDRAHAGGSRTFTTVEIVEELDPAFHLVTGGPSSTRGDVALRERWFRMIEPSARSRPWMGSVGDPCRLPLPHADGSSVRRTFGTFRYAGLRFILLDNDDVSSRPSADRGHTGGVQAGWLARTLEHAAADPAVEAVVVVMRQPAFSSATSHGYDRGVRDAWHEVFVEHGVALVLQGLDHLYERTHPLAGTAERPIRTEGGVTYVTCGNGGHARDGATPGTLPDWSAVRLDQHPGVVRVAVEPATTDRPTLLTVSLHPASGDGRPVDVATIACGRTRRLGRSDAVQLAGSTETPRPSH